MSQLGFLKQIYLSKTCRFSLVYFHRLFMFKDLTCNCAAFLYSLQPRLQNVSQGRFELNIACPLHVEVKARACGRVSSPTRVPERRCRLCSPCAVTHTHVIPALEGKTGQICDSFYFRIYRFGVWQHCKHLNVGVMVLLSLPLPPPMTSCITHVIAFALNNTGMRPFSQSFISFPSYPLLTLFIRGVKTFIDISNRPEQSEAWRLLVWCQNTSPCCVSLQGSFLSGSGDGPNATKNFCLR